MEGGGGGGQGLGPGPSRCRAYNAFVELSAAFGAPLVVHHQTTDLLLLFACLVPHHNAAAVDRLGQNTRNARPSPRL